MVDGKLEHVVFADLLAVWLVDTAFGRNAQRFAVVCAGRAVQERAAVERGFVVQIFV